MAEFSANYSGPPAESACGRIRFCPNPLRRIRFRYQKPESASGTRNLNPIPIIFRTETESICGRIRFCPNPLRRIRFRYQLSVSGRIRFCPNPLRRIRFRYQKPESASGRIRPESSFGESASGTRNLNPLQLIRSQYQKPMMRFWATPLLPDSESASANPLPVPET